MPPGLGERTMGAAQWRLAASLVQAGLQFGIGVLLARLLPPGDFGLVALALVVIGLVTLVSDLGLGRAAIQRRQLSERHVRVAFTGSVALGALMTVAVALIAPLAAQVTRTPALTPVLRAESVLFLVGGVGITARALLQRSLHFRRLFWVDFTAYGVGYAGVGLALALAGAGVWALVAAAVTQGLLASLLALQAVRHPLRPLLARTELNDLLGFGVGVSLNGVINYAARNGDNFIVGRWLGTGALGLYARAYHLMELPLLHVSAVLGSVLFPALSEIQHDRARLRRAYLLSVQMTVLVAAPVMAGMLIAAPHLVLGLYGPRWEGVIPPLQILSAVGLFRAVYHLSGAVTQASGRVYAELRRQVVYAALVIGGGLAGRWWGITGVAVGVALAITFMYVAMARLSLRIVEGGWREFARAHTAGLVVAAWVAVLCGTVRVTLESLQMGSLTILVAMIGAGAVALATGVHLLPAAARPAELFGRLVGLGGLPAPLRGALSRVLRVAG